MGTKKYKVATPKQDLRNWLDSAYGNDPIQRAAWASCLNWAIKHKPILDKFVKETGVKMPQTRQEQLILEATGKDIVLVESFVAWFNEHVWGMNPWEYKEKNNDSGNKAIDPIAK